MSLGDKSVPREEILCRIQAMGSKFELRNGRLLEWQKGGERLNMTNPPVTACKSCRKQGQWGETPLVCGVSPIRVVESWHGAVEEGKARMLVGVESLVEQAHSCTF